MGLVVPSNGLPKTDDGICNLPKLEGDGTKQRGVVRDWG
jgi:hypothetical protein